MFRTVLFVLLAVATTAAPGSWAATPAAPNASLQQEVGALVAELLLSSSLRPASRSEWLAFGGVTWESRESPGAGTSVLGLQIDEAVRREMTRRRIPLVDASAPGLPRTGGRFLRAAFQTRWSGVRMSLSLLDAQSGNLLAQVQQMLSPAALAGLRVEQIVPPDAAGALELARMIERGLGEAAPAFGLYVRTDRGTNAGYFVGDRFRVTFAADQDCHVRLYHVSWRDRRLTLLFPNRSEPAGFLSAGVPRVLPGADPNLAFESDLPYSVDAIVAIARFSPFPDESAVASALGSGGEALAGGFDRIGDYLTVVGIDSARVQQAMATGRFVPLPAPAPAPVDTTTAVAGGAAADSLSASAEQTPVPGPVPGDTATVVPDKAATDSLPAAPKAAPVPATPPAPQAPRPEERPRDMARAACYLTTLPILKPAR